MQQPNKIIIADDHPLFRHALVSMLSSHFEHLQILEAESVEELNSLLKQNQDTDLLLLDLNIPGAQGFNSLISIRETYATIGVVVVSGYEDNDTVTKAINFGAAGFIPKSTSVPNMIAAIETVLNGNMWTPILEGNEVTKKTSILADKIASLTPQQYKIVKMFAEGLLNKQIAYELGLSEATIKSHSSAIFLKLAVKNRTQAVIALNQFQTEKSSFSDTLK